MKPLGHANAADPKGRADSQPPNTGGKARHGQRAKSGGCCLWCSGSLARAGLTLLPWALLGTERGCAGGRGRRCGGVGGEGRGWDGAAGSMRVSRTVPESLLSACRLHVLRRLTAHQQFAFAKCLTTVS